MSQKNLINIKGREDFSICPECGYKGGFHITLKTIDKSASEIILVCPGCYSRFRPFWEIKLKME